ncbi:cytochrome P450 [Agromyces seonyuensis]|uniref:Cytochrome P450 n=1 Tax=Agromyces seonyuensis TaxID=2662446 RepID=A0A6I4NX52_9MICO|nr:cytochrome P450 [Agromyces seonyuensis]MWB98873.1 cytochrome P450 [Agromyces seonyuensis]
MTETLHGPVHRTRPTSSADPFSAELLADPHEFHEALREAGEVVHLERYDVDAMGRYDTVHAALTDWQSFESSAGVGISDFRREPPWRPPSLLLEADPPHHDAPRAVLQKILGPRALRALEPQWRADAAALVDEVLARGTEFDAVTELAEAFPLRVFPDAVGLRQEGREHLLPYGDHLFNTFGPENFLVQHGAPSLPEHAGWVNEQCARDALAPTGFGADIWAATDRGDITEAQAPLMVRSLLSAGVDTTIHALGAILAAFARTPEAWAALRSNPALARVAFDEAIRLESPVQTFFRTTTRDVEIDGVRIPEGRKILMFLGSANRDPRRWSDPGRFDLHRDPSGHVGFGMGIHQCVGQHVARLEAVALLTALAARVETIEPAGTPTRHLNNTLRAWETLPVRLTPDR